MKFYRFNYALRNAAGEEVDSSDGGEALSFVEGDGSMMPGLEQAVMGRSPGEQFSVSIEPEDAYGWPQRALIRTVSRAMIQSDAEEIESGMIFQMGSGEDTQVVKVVEVDGDDVTIDANHPLAGLAFHFDIEILEARDVHPDG